MFEQNRALDVESACMFEQSREPGCLVSLAMDVESASMQTHGF